MMHDVRKRFDAEIEKVFAHKPELKKYLLTHERKNICLTNLCQQISRAEGLALKVDLTTYDKLIKDIARLFAKAALQSKEDSLLTESEKLRRIAQADKHKRAEELMIDLEKEAYRVSDEIEKSKLDQIFAQRETLRVSEERAKEIAIRKNR